MVFAMFCSTCFTALKLESFDLRTPKLDDLSSLFSRRRLVWSHVAHVDRPAWVETEQPPPRFIDGAGRLKGSAKAIDVWRLETKVEAPMESTGGGRSIRETGLFNIILGGACFLGGRRLLAYIYGYMFIISFQQYG